MRQLMTLIRRLKFDGAEYVHITPSDAPVLGLLGLMGMSDVVEDTIRDSGLLSNWSLDDGVLTGMIADLS